MSKREIAARLLGSPATRKIWRAVGAKIRELRILAYHRVIDDDPISFAFDEGVISATTEAFYHQMQFVCRNFEVISFQDLYRCEAEVRSWPDRALIVTFDDGYRDNYTNAFPTLKKMGVSATIFLATGHIGRAKLFWWDEIAYLVKHTRRQRVLLSEIDPEPLRFANARERRNAIDKILTWIKQVPEEAKQSFLEKLPRELDVMMPEGLAEGRHMSWEEVKEMARSGIEFGSHTVTHPVLANVSQARLEQEISESKKAIEQNLCKEAIAFAYPVGGKLRFNQTAQEAVARYGFKY